MEPEPSAEAAAPVPLDPAVERKRVELTTQLERARRWILAIGILIYAVNMGQLWVVKHVPYPKWLEYQVSLLAGVVLLVFVLLWWFTQTKPRTCCVLALAVYWGLQIWFAILTHDSTVLFKGILLKGLFTFLLIRAIQSARNVVKLRADLAQVFA